MKTFRLDGLNVVAFGLVLIMAINLLLNLEPETAQAAQTNPQPPTMVQLNSEPTFSPTLAEAAPTPTPAPPDPAAFAAPYDWYVITQGIHGQSYGHYAIDLGGGNGAVIKSPIHGTVTELYTDGLGNPTLVIENEVYRVTMLHGVYSVAAGESVSLGDQVGTESNLGNTTDFQGRSCRNRDCGYHTHLNVFDKRLGQNVNPLDLFP